MALSLGDIIQGVVGVVVGVILTGLVAYPIVQMVIEDVDDPTLKTLFGIAVMMLVVTLIVFPIYMISKAKDDL